MYQKTRTLIKVYRFCNTVEVMRLFPFRGMTINMRLLHFYTQEQIYPHRICARRGKRPLRNKLLEHAHSGADGTRFSKNSPRLSPAYAPPPPIFFFCFVLDCVCNAHLSNSSQLPCRLLSLVDDEALLVALLGFPLQFRVHLARQRVLLGTRQAWQET